MIKQQVYINGVPTMVLQSELTLDIETGDYYKEYKQDMSVDYDKVNLLKLTNNLITQLSNAKTELASLDWINSKYVREVQILKTMTSDEYYLKYEQEYTKMKTLVTLALAATLGVASFANASNENIAEMSVRLINPPPS